jgi:MYXO-CTERM domain-containing protein
VLCFVAAPVLAAPVLYTFDVTAGNVVLNLAGQGSTNSNLAGTFAVTIFQSNGHIGDGDLVLLENGGLVNTGTMNLGIAGLVTASLRPNSARFLDFTPPAATALAGGSTTQVTDVYVEVTAFVTGVLNTSLQTKVWANSLLPFTLSFSTSQAESAILNGHLGGTFGYEIGVSDIGMTLTLDLIVSVDGTAHVVPDPALGGLTALGLGGAGAWLRRRRS